MDKLKKAWVWIREWSWALLLAVFALVGAGWAVRRKHIEAGAVRDALAVERAQRKIAELRGRRDQLLAELPRDHALVRAIDDELDENKREIVEAHEGLSEGLSDEEVADAFRRLGY
jgi:hypothetical protein